MPYAFGLPRQAWESQIGDGEDAWPLRSLDRGTPRAAGDRTSYGECDHNLGIPDDADRRRGN